MIQYVTFTLLTTVLVGCASNQIIEKSEYHPAIDQLKKDNAARALKNFPKKEKNHFVTLLEKVYLQLIDTEGENLNDTIEFEELLKQSRALDRNEQTSITNEMDQLFNIKTNEGYFPANHEIFWMHLILGMTFIKKKQIDKARIEAKKISELFARVDLKGRPFYDNPGIRMLSAALWAMCGEKENAVVDLRKISLPWSQAIISKYETKPILWDITFKGVGANIEMDAVSFANKFSGFKAIQFRSSVDENQLPIGASKPYFKFSSKQWHSGNLVRNEEFKDIIQKSKYMSRMFKSEFEYQSLNILTSAATGVVLAAGVTLGLAIAGGGIYLLGQTSSSGELAGQIFAIGFLVGGRIFDQGVRFYDSTQIKIQNERKEFQDVSRFYRFVRFIPDYFLLNEEPDYEDKKVIPFLTSKNTDGTVRLFFQP